MNGGGDCDGSYVLLAETTAAGRKTEESTGCYPGMRGETRDG